MRDGRAVFGRLGSRLGSMLLLLGWAMPAAASVAEVEGSASLAGHVSHEEARRKALGDARRRAIESAAGVSLHDQAFRVRSSKGGLQLFRETEAFSAGRIVEEQILGWTVDQVLRTRDEPPVLIMRVRLRARVEPAPPQAPGFRTTLELDRYRTVSGTPIRLAVRSSADAFLYVFNLDTAGRVHVLYPNALRPELRIRPGERLDLPQRGDGVSLVPHLPDGADSALEAIKVIASRDRLALPERADGGAALTLAEFYRWLVTLPAEARAEDTRELLILGSSPPGGEEAVPGQP